MKTVAAVAATLVTIWHVFALVRYVGRLPGDTLGIWMNVVTIILWGVVATAFIAQSRRAGRSE